MPQSFLTRLSLSNSPVWREFFHKSELPTVGDFLPGFEAGAVFGIAAPKNTPNEVVDKLNREINAALGDPKLKARIADLGGAALTGSPAAFANLLAADAEKWSMVIRAADIKMR